MKFKIKEIPREGLEIKETVTAQDLDFEVDDIEVISPLAVTGEILKSDGHVAAQVEVAGQFKTFCARCLEPVTLKRKDEFDIQVDLEPADDIVDLGEEIRQELVLALPNVVLCKEHCKGLCPSCGVNLNNEKCKCKIE